MRESLIGCISLSSLLLICMTVLTWKNYQIRPRRHHTVLSETYSLVLWLLDALNSEILNDIQLGMQIQLLLMI